MGVWRYSPIPTQMRVGIAALLPAAAVFVPQAYPVQALAGVAQRAYTFSHLPARFQAQLYPQAPDPAVPLRPDAQVAYHTGWRPAFHLPVRLVLAPALIPSTQVDSPPIDSRVVAQRAYAAAYRTPQWPTQIPPVNPELLDWYEADAAVGIGDTQQVVQAGFRPVALPTVPPRLNPALLPAQVDSPLPGLSDAVWTVFRGPAHPQQKVGGYAPAFDGPYQDPPAGLSALAPTSALAPLPAQAPRFNPALFPTVQVDSPPLTLPYPYVALGRPAAPPAQAPSFSAAAFAVAPDAMPPAQPYAYTALFRPAAPVPKAAPAYNPAFDGPYDQPPLTRQPAPPAVASVLPSQAKPFQAALAPPIQVDNPPLQLPYPYVSTWRVVPLPTQTRSVFHPAFLILPDDPPLINRAALLVATWRTIPAPAQAPIQFHPAFSGPYDTPPLARPVQFFAQAPSMPTQATFSAALLGAPSVIPPALPFQVAPYQTRAALPAQLARHAHLLVPPPDAPPIQVDAQRAFHGVRKAVEWVFFTRYPVYRDPGTPPLLNPPNVTLRTPMYTGVTLRTRIDSGITLSTPMEDSNG